MSDPMDAATLVRALKGEGCTVKAYKDNWVTHERDEATGKAFGPVHGVVIHHTGALHDADYIWSGSSSLPGPLAHAFIDKQGVVWMMSHLRANHAGGGDPDVLNAVMSESYMSRPPAPKFGEGDKGAADGNDVFYGFECENLGTGKDPWPHAQYVAMVRAAAAICRHYGWSDKSVIGHLEWSHYKSDPAGFSMVIFRADLKACLRAKPGTWPTTSAPAPAPQPAPTPTAPKETDMHNWITGTVVPGDQPTVILVPHGSAWKDAANRKLHLGTDQFGSSADVPVRVAIHDGTKWRVTNVTVNPAGGTVDVAMTAADEKVSLSTSVPGVAYAVESW